MLGEQFRHAISAARTGERLDDIARKLWRARAEGQLDDAETSALDEALNGRRAVLKGQKPPRKVRGRRREKLFGLGRPVPLDRNAKARIMHLARCLKRRTEAGKHYGVLTGKFVDVLEALLWAFHNAKTGVCFPSYETIAEAAHCAMSTVAEAIKALEQAGILTWVHRVKRVRERCGDLLGANGWRWRVLRTSNAYAFHDPGAADRPSKSEKPAGTPIQAFPYSAATGAQRPQRPAMRPAATGSA
jgi:hypothetical protein